MSVALDKSFHGTIKLDIVQCILNLIMVKYQYTIYTSKGWLEMLFDLFLLIFYRNYSQYVLYVMHNAN